MLRTHNCGELMAENISAEVCLAGWVASRRDHGEIIFMDLRDKHGVTQIVCDPEKNKDVHQKAHELRNEYCVKVTGKVTRRPEGTINPKIATGEIEIEVSKIEVLSKADTLPFEVKDDITVSEDVRLRYRYLDLRRPVMQKKLEMKHKVYSFITDFFDKEGFVSVETPMLTKSTPEGARDFLVPSRTTRGSFYALPQSPQLFKQLLMVSGLEKYYQIARCFRDEDLRADRQPEFTQLDIEMSFVEEEDIFGVCERFFGSLVHKILGRELKIPFQRLNYYEAMEKYGSDKPDTRFDVCLHDITALGAKSDFKIFKEVASSGGKVAAIAAPGYGTISRKDIDVLTAFVGEYGAKGLAYFKVENGELVSPIAKFFSREILEMIRQQTQAAPGDMIFMVADTRDVVYSSLGALRLKIGREKGLIDENKLQFLWIVNFPLFKFNKDESKWVSEHHPFTSFKMEDMELIEKNELDKIRSNSYDLVLNGSEIGSGSIRIHDRDIQQKIFDILGLTKEECAVKFGFLLEAFNYGPPPHGGVAFGLDRLVTLFTRDQSIREVISFPKTQKGTCLLTGAPTEVTEEQLRDLGIKVTKIKSEK
ncbi:MAG: aspartate--tRNA ligase [Candidatus Omnitrophica bacterium]|nr:aspartate--tRNA ligase [Candidatus Omnitrophota bacterium]